MNSCRRRWLVGIGARAALILAVTANTCAAQTEIHGALDAMATPGFALAWGVLRGRDEATTEVVVRVDADPKRFAALEVVGVDPFTKTTKPLVARAPIVGSRLIRLPRSGFADLPRTEWRLYASPPSSDPPALMVFYQGVPDTTPEFNAEAPLAESLARRIAAAQQGSREK